MAYFSSLTRLTTTLKGRIMKPKILCMSLVLGLALCTSALADSRHSYRGNHDARPAYSQSRVIQSRVAPSRVVVNRPTYVVNRPTHYQATPRVVYQYQTAPRVIYQTPEPVVIYHERPVERVVVYRDEPTYYRESDNRAAGSVVGAIAGGVIGNRFGHGSGRAAATAAGVVLGSIIGGRLADD